MLIFNNMKPILEFSSNIQEGELFLVRNIRKDKKLPNTSKQLKYTGPFEATKVTKSHVVAIKDETQRIVTYPLHLSKKYRQRNRTPGE